MKIGICGPMCSGKTTIANYIVSKDNEDFPDPDRPVITTN